MIQLKGNQGNFFEETQAFYHQQQRCDFKDTRHQSYQEGDAFADAFQFS